MKFRIDYHFHPNLPRSENKALEKCRQWWKYFKKHNINCVIVAEHSYKNPKRAFELMNKTKPARMFCIPGIEYCTKEGIDIVLFSKTNKIYSIKELKTFSLTYKETVALVLKNKSLFSFVTHPHTLGLTSVIRKIGYLDYYKYVNKLEAVEIYNGAFDNLYLLLNKFPLNLLSKSKINAIKKNQELPKKDYPKKIKFLAAGSDAHQLIEVGSCYEVNAKNAFDALTNNKGKGKVSRRKNNFSFVVLVKGAIITFDEFLTKMMLKFVSQ